MKIIATSDTHGNLPEIPECDLFIHAGDICPDFMTRFDNGAAKQAKWITHELLPWLDEVPAKKLFLVPGNHDFHFEKTRRIWPWLHVDGGMRFEGNQIWGTPWCPNLPYWAFYETERMLKERARAIPDDIDILVTHSPPYGTADICGPKYGLKVQHVGDPHLNDAIERIKPKVTICGHIHEGFGVYEMEHTTLYNVAYVNENYEPMDRLVEINLD
jgi:Icc-related predicted phosphoesterase